MNSNWIHRTYSWIKYRFNKDEAEINCLNYQYSLLWTFTMIYRKIDSIIPGWFVFGHYDHRYSSRSWTYIRWTTHQTLESSLLRTIWIVLSRLWSWSVSFRTHNLLDWNADNYCSKSLWDWIPCKQRKIYWRNDWNILLQVVIVL